MTGLAFGETRFGQRVIGNKINSGYQMPEGWGDSVPTDPTWKMGGSEERCDWALLVLEPDKSLNLKKSQCSKHTYIQMFKKTEELVETLQGQSPEKLQDLMGLSEKSAKGHAERFQNFHKLPPKQACLIFGGDCLRADNFSDSDEKYVETHLRFVSGLYGVLRPYDDVKPVRDVPFGAKLATKKGETVADFWGDAITKQLAKDGNPGGGKRPLIIFITSDEYLRAVQYEIFPKEVKVLRVCFEGSKEEDARKARSRIGRWILRRRITNREDLHDWEDEDWTIDKFRSSSARLVFSWVGDGRDEPKKDKKSKKEAAEKSEKAGKDKERGGKEKDRREKREEASRSRSRGGGGGGSSASGGGRSRSMSRRKQSGRARTGRGRKQGSPSDSEGSPPKKKASGRSAKEERGGRRDRRRSPSS